MLFDLSLVWIIIIFFLSVRCIEYRPRNRIQYCIGFETTDMVLQYVLIMLNPKVRICGIVWSIYNCPNVQN